MPDPYYEDPFLAIYGGDCREVLAAMEPASVHMVCTSPPYWGLRSYIADGHPLKSFELGLETTPEEYVANMVAVFREVRRVLRDDGTLWLNLGDSYANDTKWGGSSGGKHVAALHGQTGIGRQRVTTGLKAKDLVGIPWRVARALQEPYYTGTIHDERDRIWLAAMIDGEGCLFLHKRKVGQSNGQGYVRKNDTYGAGLEVANTSEAIVQRCMAIAGGRGSISYQDKGRNQRLYRWSMRSNECRDIVREVYPHLVSKQHQARLLLGCPSSGPDAEKAHAGLISLHNGGGSDIDFPAPASMFEPGWYLRADIVWSKLNPMPESVTDRPTKAHEYLFLLSKSARYYYDADAVREADAGTDHRRAVLTGPSLEPSGGLAGPHTGIRTTEGRNGSGRNLRSVWTIATEPYPGAHFATFPRKLVEPCVKAGTSERGVCPECGASWVRVADRELIGGHQAPNARPAVSDGDRPEADGGIYAGGRLVSASWRVTTTGWRPTCAHGDEPDPHVTHALEPVPATVLDPFAGSGTTLLVAQALGRRGVGIDLSPEYLEMAVRRGSREFGRGKVTDISAKDPDEGLWALDGA